MPLPSDIPSFIDDIAATMVADILEACSPDEIQQLIEELARISHAHKAHRGSESAKVVV